MSRRQAGAERPEGKKDGWHGGTALAPLLTRASPGTKHYLPEPQPHAWSRAVTLRNSIKKAALNTGEVTCPGQHGMSINVTCTHACTDSTEQGCQGRWKAALDREELCLSQVSRC